MPPDCHIDFETRSDVNLGARGSAVYFESPLTEPLMASYQFGFNPAPMQRWLPHEPCPADIVAHVAAGGRFVGHNAGAFEFVLWTTILTPRYGWPATSIDRWRCTMATAAAMGLPPKLSSLGEVLNLKARKDKIGKSLIDFFSKPKKTGGFNDPKDFPEKFEQFRDYCDDDVRTEAEADARMTELSSAEQKIWELDQRINQRGIRIDRQSAIAAIALIEKAKTALDAEMREITGGAVRKCSEVGKLKAWCEAQGVMVEGVAKDDILDALDLVDLPNHVERALLVRQEAGKSSTLKLAAMLKRCSADGRARNCFRYHGAAPGRWSSVGINVNNLPRPRKEFDEASEAGLIDPQSLFETIRSEDPDLLKAHYGAVLGRPLHLVSDALRSFIWAAPGRDLIAVDYSGIQGALTAWLSGEEWKLTAMREIIADPKLPDMYRRAAAGILNTSTEVVTKKHWGRQLGKVSELALGFAGSVPAFVSMGRAYLLKSDAFHGLYEPVRAAADPAIIEKAEKRYARAAKSRQRLETDTMTREAWLACMMVVLGWRATNPNIVESWAALETAMRDAVRHPGQQFIALGRITYLVAQGYLWCRLPSQRCIAYAAPRLRDQVWAKIKLDDGTWTEPEVADRQETEKLELRGLAKIEGSTSPSVTALGFDSTKNKMVRYALYGGLAMENCAMGIEADFLRRGMLNCEQANYKVVMHTYDECVAEVPRGWGSVEEMERLMLDQDWKLYEGLPLAAHGFRAKRYRK